MRFTNRSTKLKTKSKIRALLSSSNNGDTSDSNDSNDSGDSSEDQTKFPSKSPSQFPSQFPSKFPSTFPSKLPTKAPVEVIIECTGPDETEETSCRKKEIGNMDEFIQFSHILCEEPASCHSGQFFLDCDTGLGCTISCQAPAYQVAGSNDLKGACELSVFTITGPVKEIKCNGEVSCRETQFIITNPADGFKIICEGGDKSCHGLSVSIIIEDNSCITSLDGFFCESNRACRDLVVNIDNQDPDTTVTIGEIVCDSQIEA
eukprot:510900_1